MFDVLLVVSWRFHLQSQRYSMPFCAILCLPLAERLCATPVVAFAGALVSTDVLVGSETFATGFGACPFCGSTTCEV